MWIIGWIILGGLAGWVASMIAGTNREQGVLTNIFVGIIGAIIGGLVVNLFGVDGITSFNIWSFVVALLGSVVVLWAWKALRSGNRRTLA